MKKCGLCGSTGPRIIESTEYGTICDKCYQRERRYKNMTVYPLPAYGEIGYSEDGKPICHICGRAYKKIMAHVWQIHGLSAREYKEEFGLPVIAGIMCEESHELASRRNKENYEVVVEKNLMENGKDHRFKKGCEGRPREKVSEYTKKQLQERIADVNKVRYSITDKKKEALASDTRISALIDELIAAMHNEDGSHKYIINDVIAMIYRRHKECIF